MRTVQRWEIDGFASPPSGSASASPCHRSFRGIRPLGEAKGIPQAGLFKRPRIDHECEKIAGRSTRQSDCPARESGKIAGRGRELYARQQRNSPPPSLVQSSKSGRTPLL